VISAVGDFVVDTNHESRWHDLYHGLSWFVSARKFRWKLQSGRNWNLGLWNCCMLIRGSFDK